MRQEPKPLFTLATFRDLIVIVGTIIFVILGFIRNDAIKSGVEQDKIFYDSVLKEFDTIGNKTDTLLNILISIAEKINATIPI